MIALAVFAVIGWIVAALWVRIALTHGRTIEAMTHELNIKTAAAESWERNAFSWEETCSQLERDSKQAKRVERKLATVAALLLKARHEGKPLVVRIATEPHKFEPGPVQNKAGWSVQCGAYFQVGSEWVSAHDAESKEDVGAFWRDVACSLVHDLVDVVTSAVERAPLAVERRPGETQSEAMVRYRDDAKRLLAATYHDEYESVRRDALNLKTYVRPSSDPPGLLYREEVPLRRDGWIEPLLREALDTDTRLKPESKDGSNEHQ